jgi:hypothetical protein
VFEFWPEMNRGQTAAIVLLLASVVAAYEQDAHDDLEEVRPIASVETAMEADGPRPRRLLGVLLAWALGREQRVGPELVT